MAGTLRRPQGCGDRGHMAPGAVTRRGAGPLAGLARRMGRGRQRWLAGLWSVLVALTLVACQPIQPVASEQGEVTTLPEGAVDVSSLSEVEQQLVAQARADLAQELGVAAEEIQVAGVEAVDWPDASLGCPEEGMMYAQVITPGYRIELRVDGNSYEYHTGNQPDGPMVRCEPTDS